MYHTAPGLYLITFQSNNYIQYLVIYRLLSKFERNQHIKEMEIWFDGHYYNLLDWYWGFDTSLA